MRRLSFIGPDRFGPLLGLLLAMFVLNPLFQERRWGAVLLGVLVALVVVAALVASGLEGRVVRIASLLSGVVAIVTSLGVLAVDGGPPAWVTALFAAMLGSTVVLVLRRVLNHPQVTLSTVSGALCAYLLVGLAYGALYRTISEVDADAFTVELGGDASYFSFVTLTTLGYGDISPVSDLARSAAVLEAVIGQVLLVVIVARFVSTLGQERTPTPRR